MKMLSRLSERGRVLHTRISKGGQVTVPAAIRKRWGTTRVVVEDAGDRLVIRPVPEDPIGAVMGSLAHLGGPTSDEMREENRREEEEIEDRKYGKLEP